jgi:uncharacterized protein (DUF4415 family)
MKKDKIISMTGAEIMEKYGRDKEKIRAMLEAAPACDADDIPEMKGFKPGKPIRGFAAFKEYINKNGRPRADDPKRAVSIRLPASVLTRLRSTGRGWQTRVGDYVAREAKRGTFGEAAA